MSPRRPGGRRSLRQLLTHAESTSREAIEQLQTNLLPRLTALRQLSRSIRPPIVADVLHAVQQLLEADQEMRKLADSLYEQLHDIRERSRKQQQKRRPS